MGGLGFRMRKDTNNAFMTKFGWEVATSSNKPCVKLIRAKYLCGRKILNHQCVIRRRGSWIWKGIVDNIEGLKSGLCYKVGNSTNLSIWEDPWIPLKLNKIRMRILGNDLAIWKVITGKKTLEKLNDKWQSLREVRCQIQ